MHGRGKFTFPDGITYEGEVENNQLSGHGVYTWPSGAVYEGNVTRGRREGTGKLSFTKASGAAAGASASGFAGLTMAPAVRQAMMDLASGMECTDSSQVPSTAQSDASWWRPMPAGVVRTAATCR
jgi:hypothetical protein